MFSSSVRRVAFTAPQTPLTPSLTISAPRAIASQALSYQRHQRRLSSSKPSSPADGSKGVAEGDAVTSHTQARPAAEKKSSRTSKRKAKETASGFAAKGRDEAFSNLPSVPSTQHIAPQHIYASAFFSLHRPISLTSSFPKTISDDAFAAIFTTRTKANPKSSDVISTLSSTVHNLESTTGRMSQLNLGGQQDQWNSEADELRAAITAESYRKGEVHHVDGTSTDLPMNLSQLSSSANHQPFHPPPPPVPMNTEDSLAAGAEAAQAQESQHRTYTAVLTIEESTDQHGQVTYLTHSTPLEESRPLPRGFRERMIRRQERYWEQLEENGMLTLSVKRIRKLKMKKHKYKKFMKRTRNLRRRLDRN